jgi:hypothetical protein
LAQLAKDPNPRLQSLALSIYQGQQNAVDLRAEALLDFNFFAARIMPILTVKGPDGNGCINCHTTTPSSNWSRPTTPDALAMPRYAKTTARRSVWLI